MKLACLAAALSLLAASTARAQAAPEEPKAAKEPKETAIPVPVPAPSGLTLAWKPMILTVRLDTGSGSQFGSDKLQPLRAMGRYTVMAKEGTPFFGRVELEGGTFQSDQRNSPAPDLDRSRQAPAHPAIAGRS